MKKLNHMFFGLLVIITINSCSKSEKIKNAYNQKANEIILQVLKQNNCNCLLEIPDKSLIEISNGENPSYDIRNFLKSELKVENDQELNNLVNQSKNFTPNTEMLRENKIRMIKLQDIPKFGDKNDNGNVEKILKMCPKGIINLNKPVFDKTHQKAILDYSFTFTCTKTYPLPIYQYKNGKWNRIEK
jgi:hypothetical protein